MPETMVRKGARTDVRGNPHVVLHADDKQTLAGLRNEMDGVDHHRAD